MDFDRWLADLQARVAETQRKSAELTDNLATTTAAATSPDGAVKVTVGANGALHGIELSQRAAEHTPSQLSALIMKTVSKAQRQMADQVGEALSSFDESGQLMERFVAYQPPADPEELAEEGAEPSSATDFGMPDAQDAPPEPPAAVAPPTAPVPPAPPGPPPVRPAPQRAAAPRRTSRDDDPDYGEERPW